MKCENVTEVLRDKQRKYDANIRTIVKEMETQSCNRQKLNIVCVIKYENNTS